MDKPTADVVQNGRAAIVAAITALAALLTAISGLPKAFDELMRGWGAATAVARWGFVLVLAGLAIYFGARALKRRSRLLRPEAFRIDPADPRLLMGREEEIEELVGQLRTRVLVFVEGESGSGKSALLQAGLVPALAAAGMMPLYVDLAGVGWLDELALQLRQVLRERLPEHRKITAAAAKNLPALLDALATSQPQPVCLLFDQFDDYQNEHWRHFQSGGVWKTPAEIEAANPVWAAVAESLRRQAVRVVLATRDETAAGLACMQFTEFRTLHLTKISQGLIAPVLDEISRPDAQGLPVVDRPEAGWNRLKERLLADLAVRDRILPIQLVVVLEALRRLRNLTVGAYEAVGGEPGLERLHIERNAADAADAADCGMAQVIELLWQMVEADGTGTRARSAAQLEAALGRDRRPALGADSLKRALELLEQRSIVRRRPASDNAAMEVWLLRHAFLARGVAAARRHAGRWQLLLEDHRRALGEATGLGAWWRALLPPWLQLRLAWESLRGRVTFAGQGRLALASLLRWLPTTAVVVMVAAGYVLWRQEKDEALAAEIFNAIGQQPMQFTAHEDREIGKLAHASDAVREAVVRRAFEGGNYSGALNRIDVLLHVWWRLDPDGRRRQRLFGTLVPAWLAVDRPDASMYALVEQAWAQEPRDRPEQAIIVKRVLALARSENDPTRLGLELGVLAVARPALDDATCRALLEHVGQVAADASGTARALLAYRTDRLLLDRPALANEFLNGVSLTPEVARWWSEVAAGMAQVVGNLPIYEDAGWKIGLDRVRELCAHAGGQLAQQMQAMLDAPVRTDLQATAPDGASACRSALKAAPEYSPPLHELFKTLDAKTPPMPQVLYATLAALAARTGEMDASFTRSLLARVRQLLPRFGADDSDAALTMAAIHLVISANRSGSEQMLDDVYNILLRDGRARPGDEMLARVRAAPRALREARVQALLEQMPGLGIQDRWAAANLVEIFTDPDDASLRLQAARIIAARSGYLFPAYGVGQGSQAIWAHLTEHLPARSCQALADMLLHVRPPLPGLASSPSVGDNPTTPLVLLLPLAGRLDDARVDEATSRLYRAARRAQVEGEVPDAIWSSRSTEAELFVRWAATLGSPRGPADKLLDVLTLASSSLPEFNLSHDSPFWIVDLLGAYRLPGSVVPAPIEPEVSRLLRAAPMDRLVNLLKQPYALGATRRIALDAIGQQASTDFHGSVWQFVDWAQSPAAAKWKIDLESAPVQLEGPR